MRKSPTTALPPFETIVTVRTSSALPVNEYTPPTGDNTMPSIVTVTRSVPSTLN